MTSPRVDVMETKAHYVYTGLRAGADTPFVCVWRRVNEDGSLGTDTLCFNKKGKKTTLIDSWIGDVYEVVSEDGKSFRCPGPRVRGWEGKDDLAEWKLLQRQAEVSAETDKRLKAADIGGMTLDDLREQYSKVIGSVRRSAMIATVIQYVTK